MNNEIMKAKISMTTMEIAEQTGKRHDHVLRDTRKMLSEVYENEPLPNFGELYIAADGNNHDCFRLPKREVIILVSGYSTKFRTAIIDRLEVLERQQIDNIPEQLPRWMIESNGINHFLKRYNAPEHMIAITESKHIYELGGPDLRNIVGELPCAQDIKKKDIFLEPTEFGLKYGLTGYKFNKLLSVRGLQVKTKSGWEPTKKGKKLSIKHSWLSGGKSGYNYKWNVAGTMEVIG